MRALAMTQTSTGGTLREIERRSIDFVPEDERHGRVSDQGPSRMRRTASGALLPALGSATETLDWLGGACPTAK